MKNTFSRSKKFLGFLFCSGLALGLGGCAVGLYHSPAVAEKVDPKTSYPPLDPNEVYFFLSKDAFPQGLLSVPVGSIRAPSNTEWARKDLIREFQKKAAEIGANAIVFDSVQPGDEAFGYRIYKGIATCYRLFKKDPSEDVDLSSTRYGTQDPDLRLVK
ncbi:MAG TPA: hypothetical protein VIJ93_12675 [bacterium]